MNSLRGRLTRTLALGGTVLLSGLVIAGYLRASKLMTAQFDDSLRARASALASLLLWNPDGSVELDFKDEFMPELEQPGGGFYFAVWRQADGSLVEQSSSLAGSELPRFGGPVEAPERQELVLPDGTHVRALGLVAGRESDDDQLHPTHSPLGGAIVVVAGDTSALRARLRAYLLELAVGGTAALGLLVLAVRKALHGALAPLTKVSEFAAGLDAKRLDQRFPVAGLPDELAPIAARLNDLLARLQQAFDRERRFSADVAHELHTPIAELRTLAEVGERIPGTNSETAAFFHDAGDIARRMEDTVATLRLLARCESDRQSVERKRVVLREALQTHLDRAKTAARKRSILFADQIPPGLSWETDPDLLSRLLNLLLDNALQYTGRPGRISLEATTDSLCLRNGPTDLTAADLAHLGERFWRKDVARASDHHAGLGLALALELARVLDLHLQSSLGPDTAFTQRLERGEKREFGTN